MGNKVYCYEEKICNVFIFNCCDCDVCLCNRYIINFNIQASAMNWEKIKDKHGIIFNRFLDESRLISFCQDFNVPLQSVLDNKILVQSLYRFFDKHNVIVTIGYHNDDGYGKGFYYTITDGNEDLAWEWELLSEKREQTESMAFEAAFEILSKRMQK